MTYYGEYKGKTLKSNSMRGLKLKASKEANKHTDAIDELRVSTETNGAKEFRCVYRRINSIAPNNSIKRGTW